MSPMRIGLPAGPATFGRRMAVVLGLAACAALGACGSSPAPGSAAGAGSALSHLKALGARHPAAVHPRPKAGAPGRADLVAAVAGEKSAVPVQVQFALRGRPEIGKPVELDVEVTPTGPLGRLVTSFHAEDGLEIERGAGASATDRPEPGVPLSRALTIVARHDGIFYVSATVLVDAGADSVARTFTIPVITGAGAS